MACVDIAGNTWRVDRLLIDGAADAVEEVRLALGIPDANGNFSGSFRDPNGNPIPDTLTGGLCMTDGPRHRIEFTRQHASGTITTVYSGRVTIAQPSGDVLIRGRFIRTTTSNGRSVSVVNGDYETEKPT